MQIHLAVLAELHELLDVSGPHPTGPDHPDPHRLVGAERHSASSQGRRRFQRTGQLLVGAGYREQAGPAGHRRGAPEELPPGRSRVHIKCL